jgi:hypothetical protein
MRVYVGSTYSDLKDYRRAVIEALQRLDDVVVSGLEYFAAADVPPLDRCIAEVHKSDVYLLILGHRYGFVPENHSRSITELEFEEARKQNKPVMAFILSDDVPVRRSSIETDPNLVAQLEAFKNRVRSTGVSSFQSPEDLATRTILTLRNFQAGTSRPPSIPGIR